MNRSVCKLRNSCPNRAGSRQIYHLMQRIIKHFSAINLFFFVIIRTMTSQGRSENSDQSGPLHPMLPNADRMNHCLLSTPRMACGTFSIGFFNGSAQRLFSTPPTGFPNTSNAFSDTSNGNPTGTQRVPNGYPTLCQRFKPFNGKALVYVFP